MDGAVLVDAENEALAKRCEAVADAALGAVEWVGLAAGEVREEGPVLARDLRRASLRARKLAGAARRPMCVSVFGPSQQGKSYLIASLARRAPAPTTIRFGAETRLFNRDINPDGGKESTGLVTRFSVRAVNGLPGMPVVCRMLSETDIVKIMANAFMEDFDRDTVKPLEPAQIEATLARLRPKASREVAGPLTEDDIYDLFEYFERYFLNHPTHLALKPAHWREIETLAPRLPIPDRAELYGLLWNATPTMTATALKLIQALEKLGFPDEACCPMAAVEPKASSIIDVETMSSLGKGDGDPVPVATRAGRRAELPRAVLTAVVAELQLQLDERPFDFFDHTDLLDFPGARGREKYNAAKAEEVAQTDLFMLLRRGKVAYLYQRYLAEQELTSMLLCLKHSNQEVRTVPAMVRDWIDATHGATPERRQGRDVALFLVLTMFDMEFEVKGGAEDSVERWSTRLKTTIFEFLGLGHDWPAEWAPGTPFGNTFWLRNPEVKNKGLLDYDADDREAGFREPGRMAELKANFLANPDVRRHFADPERAWEAGMALNDGGIGLIAERLRPVCNPETKRAQVRGALALQAGAMAASLRPYYVSSDVEAELQKRLAEARGVAASLGEAAKRQAFGLLLGELQVSVEALAEVFRAAQFQVSDDPMAVRMPVGTASEESDLDRAVDDIFGDAPAAPPRQDPAAEAAPRPRDMADVLAEAALAHWLERLHRFAAREDLLPLFGMDREAAASLTGQLATASRRVGLRQRVADAIRRDGAFHERLGDQLAKRVLLAEGQINEFVYALGARDLPPERRPQVAGRAVFTRTRPAPDQWPELAERPAAFEREIYVDWVASYRRLVEENARAAAGLVGDPALNERLGRVLQALAPAA